MPTPINHSFARARLTDESSYGSEWNFPRCYAINGSPTTSDDETLGFWYGSFWLDSSQNNGIYVCTDPTTSAAIWGFLKF